MKSFEVNAVTKGGFLVLELSVDILQNKEMLHEIEEVVEMFCVRPVSDNMITELEQAALDAIWRVLERQSTMSVQLKEHADDN